MNSDGSIIASWCVSMDNVTLLLLLNFIMFVVLKLKYSEAVPVSK